MRQGVELPAMHPGRHQVVPRTLGRGLGEDRRLDLVEPLGGERRPGPLKQAMAQGDVALKLGATQVEVSVHEA